MFEVFLVVWFLQGDSQPQQIADNKVESVAVCEEQAKRELDRIAEVAAKHQGPWSVQVTCMIEMPKTEDAHG